MVVEADTSSEACAIARSLPLERWATGRREIEYEFVDVVPREGETDG